jgi:chromosome segregation ATPase
MLISIGCASVDSVDPTNERLDQLEQRIPSMEARESAQQKSVTRELDRLRVERADMQKRFTSEHPALIRINDRIDRLERAEAVRNVQSELQKLEAERSHMAGRHTDKHPSMMKIDKDMARLNARLDELMVP